MMWLVYMCRIFIITTMLAVLFHQVLQQHCCFGCLEEERLALLELKAYWYNNNENLETSFVDDLSSWNSDVENSECCSWKRIECNNKLRRVTKLDLSQVRMVYSDVKLTPWYLNSSLFLPFLELHTLDLSWNGLFGTIKDEGFERISLLTNLVTLDLSGNPFNDSILPLISTISSLTNLIMRGTSLRSWNEKDLKMLNKLEHLRLSRNFLLDARILDSVDKLPRLTHLDLGYNHIGGLLVSNNTSYLGLCRLKRLEQLYLNDNNFEGTLPPCLGNLTSLRVLDLEFNRFVGNIASSPLVNLVSLEELYLSRNQFKSLTPLSSLANHSKLVVFQLMMDGVDKLQVETDYPNNWIPSFQLQELSLSTCNFINKPKMIPNFLYHQTNLIRLDISSTNLQGEFLSWLLRNNTRLKSFRMLDNSLIGPLDLPSSSQYSKQLVEFDLSKNYIYDHLIMNNLSTSLPSLQYLYLSNNHIHGHLPISIGTFIPNLKALYLSNNHIHGHLPINIGTFFPNLVRLDLSNNSFYGGIPSSIGNMSFLGYLDLSNNYLYGKFPTNLVRACTSLKEIKLSHNQLHGQISSLIFNTTSLKSLHLNGNKFIGIEVLQSTSLTSITNSSSNLEIIDVSDNNIMDGLSNWLGNMRTLIGLRMSQNHIQGPIPKTLCNLQVLQVLDLSDNNIIGLIPSCFNPPLIRYLNLRRNGLTGSFMNSDKYVFMSNSTELVVLDLGENKMSGSIASIISGSFSKLRILALKKNHFQGLIPKQLCHLYQISMIDLSFNYLSGPIPSCLGNLTFKTVENETDFDPFVISIISFLNIERIAYGLSEESVEYTSKKRNEIYQGNNLIYVSGIDLSSNQLVGTIPHEIGNLSHIHTLNLSHNCFTGSIPSTFSKMDSIESLDLSYNNLSGSIPLELVQLTKLAVFSVVHNNLSRKIPNRKAQFATFDESSYDGNPFLCGPPLNRSCSNSTHSITTPTPLEDSNFVIFIGSFVASFVMGFLGVILVLYINPYWRRVWFDMVDEWICSFNYFLLVVYYKLKHFARA